MAVKIVVLRDLGLGDLLAVVPALRGLRRRFPEARIHLVAGCIYAPLVNLFGTVDLVGRLPRRRSDHFMSPNLAVNLHGSGPQSIRRLQSIQPREMLTYHHSLVPEVDGPQWLSMVNERARWTSLVGRIGAQAEPDEVGIEVPQRTPAQAGAAVVHIGAGAPARRWPAVRFAAVVAGLAAHQQVVITGDRSERETAVRVARSAGLCVDNVLAGRLSLVDLAGLVAHAPIVVSGDTGIAHLASAYARPSVTLFGPVSPQSWGPPAGLMHRVLWAGECGDPHEDTVDPGLLAIGPLDVLAAATDVLDQVCSG